jgi:hypothetical protein
MAHLDLNPKPPTDNRMLAIGLAVAAAAMLVFAAFSRMWVARPLPEIGFGPLGCSNCATLLGEGTGGMSNSAFLDKIVEYAPSAKEDISSAFVPMGYATFGLALIAAIGLLAAAGIAFKKARPELRVSPASVALLAQMGALVTGCVFVATKPGGPGFVGVSLGFWIFGIGAVAGMAGAQMLSKLIRPVDPDLLADSMNPDAY